MASPVYIEYTIVLRDKAQVEALQVAQSRWNSPRNDMGGTLRTRTILGRPLGGFGKYFCSPERAALEFPGCVIRGFGTSDPMPTGPYIASIHIWANALPGRWPTDLDVFTRPRVPVTLFSGNVTYIWYGVFVYAPPVAVTIPPGEVSILPIEQMRWAEGFELPIAGAGGSQGARMGGVCPQASRHLGGYGMLISEETANSVQGHLNAEFRTGLAPTASWERLYIRIDQLPSASLHFWRMNNSAGGSRALVVSLTPSGNLAIYDQTGATTYVLIGTTEVLPNGDSATWLKCDLIAAPGAAGTAKLYINQVLKLDLSGFVGWGAVGTHVGSDVGKLETSAASVGGCLAVDDWTSHDAPVTLNIANNDWLNGTKVVRLDPIAYGADHNAAIWTKDVAHFMPLPAGAGPTANYQTTSDAGAPKFSTLLDIEDKVLNDPQAINGGIIAAFFGLFHSAAVGATNGTLDYSLDGAAFVTKAIPFPGGSPTLLGWTTDSNAYLPTGLAEPKKLNTLGLRFTPGASAHARTIGAIGAVAVVVGVFGAEDLDPAAEVVPVVPTNRGNHQHWYERSAWAVQKLKPAAPVVTKTGTYVGNGTVTRLEFPFPVNFFHVRRVTATSADGATWFSSMVAASEGWQREMSVEGMIRATWEAADPPPAEGDTTADGQCILTIVGNLASGGGPGAANESGVTYQYIAMMDPGARLSLAGSIRHSTTAAANPRTTLLKDPEFLPIAGFFRKPDTAVSGTFGGFFKGPGHAANQLTRLDGTDAATALAFAEGVLTNFSGFNNSVTGPATDFHLFRLDDGSDDPGIPKTLQITSYVGDGTASRNLGLIPTGQRPMWAMVIPANAAAIFRDPSHTGTGSSLLVAGGNALTATATGITAGGIDQIFLGSTLNANGIVYNVIVFMGCTTGLNNGWSDQCEVAHIVPIVPPCDPAEDEECPEECEEDLDDEELCGEEECDPDVEDCDEECDPDVEDCEGECEGDECEECDGEDCGPPEFGSQCVQSSQRVCSQALSEIGISQVLRNITLDETPEAEMCRLHYADAIDEVLREHPWDFATKYADLLWLEGTAEAPVNHDWAYRYQLPADCLFVRRLVEPSVGRVARDTPPPFRQAANNTTGKVLYTNYFDPEWTATLARPVQVTIEYTFRSTCVASMGDALFREALKWKMAQKLAPTLSRNKVKAAECHRQYLIVLMRAKTINMRGQQTPLPQTADPSWLRARGTSSDTEE